MDHLTITNSCNLDILVYLCEIITITYNAFDAAHKNDIRCYHCVRVGTIGNTVDE